MLYARIGYHHVDRAEPGRTGFGRSLRRVEIVDVAASVNDAFAEFI
ncbi:hypothetical protein MAUB_15880 [Mycolicibacterium aubagnense]|uniref:Uncharacterized protein n=1 Tax=Mycolicibacterium aubagnense TaxID=319707 RepID=A0ABN5YRW1_9MYCO|nr:hypothetical protein MAUB_15880 [Mycolicibacterium aubagnense]